jgi:hypothetical protein
MESRGKRMKHLGEKDRKELEAKLANVFQENIDQLPTELREILLDDMVTAFENRLNVLNRAGEKAEN